MRLKGGQKKTAEFWPGPPCLQKIGQLDTAEFPPVVIAEMFSGIKQNLLD